MNPLIEYFNSTHAIACGDCIDVMFDMPPGHVDLVVTSPPYPGQKGDNRTVEEWLDWFDTVMGGIERVLSPTGILCLNVMFKRTDALFYDMRLFTHVPVIVQNHGFNPIDVCPFGKTNPAPNGSMKRFDLAAWEPVFIYTKSPSAKDYYYEAYRKPYKPKSLVAGGNRVYSTRGDNIKPHPNGAQQSNLLFMSTSGENNRPRAKGQSYPTELPYQLIHRYCPPNGVVFDPFSGVGTTQRAAQMLNRCGYGAEISHEEIIKAMLWLSEPFDKDFLDQLEPSSESQEEAVQMALGGLL